MPDAGGRASGQARCGRILAGVSPVKPFIRDMSPFFQSVSRDDKHGLVVMVWDDSRKLAVEIPQLDGSASGPWPDTPPLKICCSAGAEPGRANRLSPLSAEEPHVPSEYWDTPGTGAVRSGTSPDDLDTWMTDTNHGGLSFDTWFVYFPSGLANDRGFKALTKSPGRGWRDQEAEEAVWSLTSQPFPASDPSKVIAVKPSPKPVPKSPGSSPRMTMGNYGTSRDTSSYERQQPLYQIHMSGKE